MLGCPPLIKCACKTIHESKWWHFLWEIGTIGSPIGQNEKSGELMWDMHLESMGMYWCECMWMYGLLYGLLVWKVFKYLCLQLGNRCDQQNEYRSDRSVPLKWVSFFTSESLLRQFPTIGLSWGDTRHALLRTASSTSVGHLLLLPRMQSMQFYCCANTRYGRDGTLYADITAANTPRLQTFESNQR